MHKRWRVPLDMGWRMVASGVGFYACAAVGDALQQQWRGDYRTPASWAISLALTFYSWCLLALLLAGAAQLPGWPRRATRSTVLVGGLYVLLALGWCGVWAGYPDRPFRLLYIIGCGLAGLLMPWGIEQVLRRNKRRPSSS